MLHTSRRFLAISILLSGLSMSASLSAADHRDRYEARTFADDTGQKLSYRLLRPKGYDARKSYPLVLFLHGAGERGSDNKIQLVHGMNDFASDEIMAKYPAFVIAPQCPVGEAWGGIRRLASSTTSAGSSTQRTP